MRFSVIGGDVRQANLAGLIAADGHAVSLFGVDAPAPDPPVEVVSNLQRAMVEADCVVLPIPVAREAGLINAPALRNPHALTELIALSRPGQILAGGRMPRDLCEQGREAGLHVLDFLEREDFAVRNAVPTAEGALQIAMEKTRITLHGARCLVIGCGRIGRILAVRLAALGSRVTVSARKQADFAWIEVSGYSQLETGRMQGHLGQFDVIFNTVPEMVLSAAHLRELSRGCLCIDLASTPGGVDFDAAHELGVPCVWALGLPGKVAPRTAGVILRDTLYHIIKERRTVP